LSPRPRQSPRRWFLLLDGTPAGFLVSVDGGAATADVVAERGSAPFVRKRLGPVRYEPITLSFGLAVAPAVFEWIRSAWAGESEQRSGSILTVGADGDVVGGLDFSSAVVAETTLPRLDAAAKSQATIQVTIAPDRTSRRKGSGPMPPWNVKQKQWIASNFRVAIDGLDCSRVSSVDALTIRTASPVDFPPLRVTLSASTQQSWVDWHEEFVIEGVNDDAHEKSGTLSYLAPNLATELGRVKLSNLGIVRLASESGAQSQDAVPRVVADLYCERFELAL
jgi:T4-like virus tail tube protein gp19